MPAQDARTRAKNPDLRRVSAAYRKAADAANRLSQNQTALREAIRAAHEAGVRQVDLVAETGYTREHIRRICKTPAGG